MSRPERFPELIPGDDFAGMLQQEQQDLERFLLQMNPPAALAQLSLGRVELERREAQELTRQAHWRDAGVLERTSQVRRCTVRTACPPKRGARSWVHVRMWPLAIDEVAAYLLASRPLG